jgi:hypothetical protein
MLSNLKDNITIIEKRIFENVENPYDSKSKDYLSDFYGEGFLVFRILFPFVVYS